MPCLISFLLARPHSLVAVASGAPNKGPCLNAKVVRQQSSFDPCPNRGRAIPWRRASTHLLAARHTVKRHTVRSRYCRRLKEPPCEAPCLSRWQQCIVSW